jgi:hypothetical protein
MRETVKGTAILKEQQSWVPCIHRGSIPASQQCKHIDVEVWTRSGAKMQVTAKAREAHRAAVTNPNRVRV